TSIGRLISVPTSRLRVQPACTSLSSAATRPFGRRATRTASTAATPRTGPWSATRRPTPTRPSPQLTRQPRRTPGAILASASTPPDGGRAENALAGVIFTVNGTDYRALQVPYPNSRTRFWRNTTVANLASGQTATITAGCSCLIGNEWDEDLDNGFRPAGLMDLSSSTYTVNSLLQDQGSTYAVGTATHSLALYRSAGGGLVFGAGTVDYSWGLDGTHDVQPSTPDTNLRQATVNLLADMGVQPGTLQPGLVTASAS